jgi:group II intron reverse transcriptase/maturase
MHHFNEGTLKECSYMLDGRKAVGIDGISKSEYAKNLDGNIRNLVERMKRMAYRPAPVKQVQIPKEGKAGATRPLGISNFEDKIVQKMMQRVLESIYEPLFLKCSYGFRPGIGCHDAIRDLQSYLYKKKVETVIDIDLANYFGSIDVKLLEQMLRAKIKDEKLMRYIIRLFKAGVLTDGELTVSEEGVVQGSCASPILANIFAHYVIDKWVEEEVKPRCAGHVWLCRYCDDAVICCQYEKDANRIRVALGKRLARFKLKLNEEKTKLVDFRKIAGKRASFDFLGFTHYLGKARNGRIIPKLKTIGKRLNSKLKRVSEWACTIKDKIKLAEIWKLFCQKLQGHINYYAVSYNTGKVRIFIDKAIKIMFKWLNRRSQRNSFNWEQFRLFIKANPLPTVKVCHKLF